MVFPGSQLLSQSHPLGPRTSPVNENKLGHAIPSHLPSGAYGKKEEKQMKRLKLITVLLALLLAAMVTVPMVSAAGAAIQPSGKGDLVDKFNLSVMTPPLLIKLESQGLSEDEIAQYILKMEKPRQDGWTEKDNELAVSYLKRYRQNIPDVKSPMYQDVQKDGRMVIYEANYNGINGYMRPGNLEVSSTGTEAHYITSHLGYGGRWIEVGVARFNYNPTQYVVYTYDSGRPAGQEWKTWGTTDPNVNHHFLLYVYPTDDGSGYPYAIWWDDTAIDSGHTPYYWNNPDENHEFFAANINNFQTCSQGYFENSFLYKKEGNNYNAYWWNGNLPETTDAYSLSPVLYSRTIPYGSSSYKMITWIN